MTRIKTKQATGAALALTSLLALAACSDPGATAATAPSSGSSTTAAGKSFNLAPEQDRVKTSVDAEAAA
jgi:polar amino acid transport system substrate-binding protein